MTPPDKTAQIIQFPRPNLRLQSAEEGVQCPELDEADPIEPDLGTVALLERLLVAAKEGRVIAIQAVLALSDGTTMPAWSGVNNEEVDELALLGELQLRQVALVDHIEGKRMGPILMDMDDF